MTNDAALWSRVQDICHAALALDACEREAFVTMACRGDAKLRRDVESLLVHEGTSDRFLRTSAVEMVAHAIVADSRESLIGRQVGPYEILALIGAGGMGEVYRARDRRLDRDVAIKVIPPAFNADRDRLRRFELEARAAAALNHSNIVALYDIGSHDDAPYIVSELLEGEALAQQLTRGALDAGQALDVAVQVGQALAAAHEKGIVHRDLKPANVFITIGRQVKVLDFGLAKMLRSGVADITAQPTALPDRPLTVTGTVLGTTAYMSPEQAEGKPLDARSDVFSFGVMLYEMLAGRRPFAGDSQASLMSAILRDPVPSLKNSGVDVHADLDRILQRCLEKDPAKRYADGRRLLDDLRHVVEQQQRAGSHRTSRLAKAWAVGAGVALAVAAVFAVFGAWLPARAGRSRAAVDTALARIEPLTAKGRYYEALRIARQAEREAPMDARLWRAVETLTVSASVTTTPDGADVYIADYRASPPEWEHLGKSPLQNIRLPTGMLRWKVEKPGYETVESGFWSAVVPARFTLHRTRPDGMVFVPGGRVQMGVAPAVVLPDYWIDRYEVTNRAFQKFVDAGGYQTRAFWKQPFDDDGRALSWEEAMVRLRDRSGRPGPAGWELGAFPDGEADIPVHGISWYEAAAYAEFAGKTLPTVYHWTHAAGTLDYENVSVASNFSGKGPAPAGANRDVGVFGTYQMAGNVKEWCWNSFGSRRYILGGAWGEPTYMAASRDARRPLDRSEMNGFRTVKYTVGPPPFAGADVDTNARDYSVATRVSDDVFAAFRRMYAYDRTELQPRVELTETTEYWKREKISFAAAYGNERVIAQVLLPLNAAPPYQTVIWFGGADVAQLPSSDTPGTPFYFDFLVRSGHAVVLPVFQGTYERRAAGRAAGPNAERDLVVARFKDLGRTLDYLETRPDIDPHKLAYYGFSLGANDGVVLVALEPRIKTAILVSGSLPKTHASPEVDRSNFAPRIKVPVLMLNGRDDFGSPVESSQKPLFALLGTPPDQKQHVVVEGGHAPPRMEMIRHILAWLDRYLGPVSMTSH